MNKLFLLFLFSCSSFAIEIQSKKQNTDRQLYIINPSAKIQKNKIQFGVNSAYSTKPLITKNIKNNKKEDLISDVLTFDFNLSYKLNNNNQIGFLTTIHQINTNLNEKINYLDSLYIESKYNVYNNLSVVPFIFLPKNEKVNIRFDQKIETIQLGQLGGAYGFKLVQDLELWQKHNVSFFTSIKKSIKNDVFKTIDQSLVYSAGISTSFNLHYGFDWKNELYLDKLKNNTPVEFLSYINYTTKNNLYHAGLGTGNIQTDGANEIKFFFGLTFLFDENYKKLDPSKPTYQRNFENKQKLEEEYEIEEAKINNSFSYNTKKNRSIASKKSDIKILPNGQKVKVFKNKITEMPSDKGVLYINEKEYQKLLKTTKPVSKKETVFEQKAIESQPLVSDNSVNSKEELETPIVQSDEDPVLNIINGVVSDIVDLPKTEENSSMVVVDNDVKDKIVLRKKDIEKELLSLEEMIIRKKKDIEEKKAKLTEELKIKELIDEEKNVADKVIIEKEVEQIEVSDLQDTKIKEINYKKNNQIVIDVPFIVKKTIKVNQEIKESEKIDISLEEKYDIEEINDTLF